jgi:hypothetical protein
VLKIGNFEALFLEAFTMGKPYNINFKSVNEHKSETLVK